MKQWCPPPHAPPIPAEPPLGVRTPNGLVWAPSLDDFLTVDNALWSRSMVNALGDQFGQSTDADQARPRPTPPWPVLHALAPAADPSTAAAEEGATKHADPDVLAFLAYTVPAGHDDLAPDAPTGVRGAPLAAGAKPGEGSGAKGDDVEDDADDDDADDGDADDGDADDDVAGAGSMAADGEDIKDDPSHDADAPSNATPTADAEPPTSKQEPPAPTHDDTPGEDVAGAADGGPMDIDNARGDGKADMDATPNDADMADDAPIDATPIPDSTPPTCEQETTESAPGEDSSAAPKSEPVDLDAAWALFRTHTSQHSYRCQPVHQCGLADTDGPQADTAAATAAQLVEECFVAHTSRADDPGAWSRTARKSDVPPSTLQPVPKLEEFIPDERLPEYLIVHDPGAVTSRYMWHVSHAAAEATRYRRLHPAPGARDDGAPRSDAAHLYLHRKHQIGQGNHSLLFRAPLVLAHPTPCGRVSVAAKVASSRLDVLHLANEARTYDALPRHMQEDWSGFNVVPGVAAPVRVGAVVPKFYGYYVPDDGERFPVDADDGDEEDMRKQRERLKYDAKAVHSPVLLLEECGTPVEPWELTEEARRECYSLVVRLHHEGVLQQSMYVRNMLVQPGPLSVPPGERSTETQSFRIIDFGRALQKEMYDKYEAEEEKRRARRELLL